MRAWQLGIEMRPLFSHRTWTGYPIFMAVSMTFGYYIEGVEDRQFEMMEERKQKLLAKRARQAEREARGEGGMPAL